MKQLFLINVTLLVYQVFAMQTLEEKLHSLGKRVADIDFDGEKHKIYGNIIDGNTFKEFTNLQRIKLNNVDITELTTSAIPETVKSLNLTNNYISKFDFNKIEANYKLEVLDLSSNLLSNLVNFKDENFPRLQLLDLSYNFLEDLPKGLVVKTMNDANFTLIIDENPLSYGENKWKDFVKRYTSRKKYHFDNSQAGIDDLSSRDPDNSTSQRENPFKHCMFIQCGYWFFGGIWIGIILGNINKIKKLIFRRTRITKNTAPEN